MIIVPRNHGLFSLINMKQLLTVTVIKNYIQCRIWQNYKTAIFQHKLLVARAVAQEKL